MISGMRVRRRSSAGAGGGYRFYRLYMPERPEGAPLEIRLSELYLDPGDGSSFVPSGGTESASDHVLLPFRAFDGDISSYWSANGGFPYWIQYEFPDRREFVRYGLVAATGTLGPPRAPRIWEFLASNDGINWKVLDTQSGQSWSNQTPRWFNL